MKRILAILRWVVKNGGLAEGFNPSEPVPPPGSACPCCNCRKCREGYA